MLPVLSHRYTENCDMKVQKKSVCIMMCHDVLMYLVCVMARYKQAEKRLHLLTDACYPAG